MHGTSLANTFLCGFHFLFLWCRVLPLVSFFRVLSGSMVPVIVGEGRHCGGGGLGSGGGLKVSGRGRGGVDAGIRGTLRLRNGKCGYTRTMTYSFYRRFNMSRRAVFGVSRKFKFNVNVVSVYKTMANVVVIVKVSGDVKGLRGKGSAGTSACGGAGRFTRGFHRGGKACCYHSLGKISKGKGIIPYPRYVTSTIRLARVCLRDMGWGHWVAVKDCTPVVCFSLVS